MRITLKLSILLLFGFLLGATTSERVFAQKDTIITYDSLWINSIVSVSVPNDTDSIVGPANHQQMALIGAQYALVQFSDGTNTVPMQPGSKLEVYWARETTDSCALSVNFLFDNDSGVFVNGPFDTIYQSGGLYKWNETILTVPTDSTAPTEPFNTLALGVPVNINLGEPTAQDAFVDAIVLLQQGSLGVAQQSDLSQTSLQNYPNPFSASSGTDVRIHASQVTGDAVLSVSDALGREVERLPIGEISAGADISVKFSAPATGIYFVRLFVNGSPAGLPIEISAE